LPGSPLRQPLRRRRRSPTPPVAESKCRTTSGGYSRPARRLRSCSSRWRPERCWGGRARLAGSARLSAGAERLRSPRAARARNGGRGFETPFGLDWARWCPIPLRVFATELMMSLRRARLGLLVRPVSLIAEGQAANCFAGLSIVTNGSMPYFTKCLIDNACVQIKVFLSVNYIPIHQL